MTTNEEKFIQKDVDDEIVSVSTSTRAVVYGDLMDREFDSITTIYVEGSSDTDIFNYIFDTLRVRIKPMQGKDNVMRAMKRLSSSKRERTIAIIDSDFDRITGKYDSYKDDKSIFATDTHDIETMQFREKRLFQVRPEDYANLKKIEENGMTLEGVWRRIFEICSMIGKVRLMSQEKNLGLPITNDVMKEIEKVRKDILITLRTVGKKQTIDFYFSEFLKYCSKLRQKRTGINNSFEPVYSDEELRKYYEEYKDKEYDIWQLCNGHDMVKVVKRVFSTEIVGSNRKNGDEFFGRDLRRTYVLSGLFEKTKLCEDLKEWNDRHEMASLFPIEQKQGW